MSGSSALASARRRRASTEPSIQPNKNLNSIKEEQEDISKRQLLTPIQLLKTHEKRLTDLELGNADNFNLKNDNEILKQLNLEIKEIKEENKNLNKKLDNINLIINQKGNISENVKNYLNNNKEDVRNTIISSISNELDKILDEKLKNINNNINIIQNNIQNLLDFESSINEQSDRLLSIIEEFNQFKFVVVKSQLLSIETNRDISKLKDKFLYKIDESIKNDNIDLNPENQFKDSKNETDLQLAEEYIEKIMGLNIDEILNTNINISDDVVDITNHDNIEIVDTNISNNICKIQDDISSSSLEVIFSDNNLDPQEISELIIKSQLEPELKPELESQLESQLEPELEPELE